VVDHLGSPVSIEALGCGVPGHHHPVERLAGYSVVCRSNQGYQELLRLKTLSRMNDKTQPRSRTPSISTGLADAATAVRSNSHAWMCRVGFFRCSCCGNRAFTFAAYGVVMFRYVVVRLWLADRPGSLGQIATRIGELGGDLVGIDILERDGARAVDELTVELPDGYSPEALANALSELSGVEVEDLRHRVSEVPYAGRDPLDAAVLLAEALGPTELSSVLARGVCTSFTCDWCTVLDMSDARAVVLAEAGDAPSAAWLGAFAAGARAGLALSTGSGAGLVGPRDVAWSPLDSSGLVVVAGRDGPPFRSRERRQLQQLCRVADARWSELVRTGARTLLSGTGQSRNQRLAAS